MKRKKLSMKNVISVYFYFSFIYLYKIIRKMGATTAVINYDANN